MNKYEALKVLNENNIPVIINPAKTTYKVEFIGNELTEEQLIESAKLVIKTGDELEKAEYEKSVERGKGGLVWG